MQKRKTAASTSLSVLVGKAVRDQQKRKRALELRCGSTERSKRGKINGSGGGGGGGGTGSRGVFKSREFRPILANYDTYVRIARKNESLIHWKLEQFQKEIEQCDVSCESFLDENYLDLIRRVSIEKNTPVI